MSESSSEAVPLEPLTTWNYRDYPAMNQSSLKVFNASRRLYRCHQDGWMNVPSELQPANKFDALNEGTATHMWLLEPKRAQRDIAVWTGKQNRSLSAFRSFKQREREDGKTVLMLDQWWLVITMQLVVEQQLEGVLQHPSAMREWPILWNEVVELDSWQDSLPESKVVNVPCKALLDFAKFTSTDGLIIDIKTSSELMPKGFFYATKRFDYWAQVAHYSRALSAETGLDLNDIQFSFAVVSSTVCEQVAKCMRAKAPPYLDHPDNYEALKSYLSPAVEAVAPLAFSFQELSAMDVIDAHRKWASMIHDYAWCVETGNWSDLGEGNIRVLSGVVE
ncbi:hypothetical protein KOR42_23810 [Thalassoglobus neptunius]|uniref:Uncharacterized protein n=1 Tax=Thalassoglobus neptunius TaxID=1938619 RepID=A0A5C5X7Z0_9PLAN|nr:PD-(D/E)XK nuclease-like domain-containing protein [Thalassoglobus neptunius]TWT58994.1 hypothetical protein KOR42_23810 [Thalassoglobus neptunius]